MFRPRPPRTPLWTPPPPPSHPIPLPPGGGGGGAAVSVMSSGKPHQAQCLQTWCCGLTVHHCTRVSDAVARVGTCGGCHCLRVSADTPPTALRRASSAPSQGHKLTWFVCACVHVHGHRVWKLHCAGLGLGLWWVLWLPVHRGAAYGTGHRRTRSVGLRAHHPPPGRCPRLIRSLPSAKTSSPKPPDRSSAPRGPSAPSLFQRPFSHALYHRSMPITGPCLPGLPCAACYGVRYGGVGGDGCARGKAAQKSGENSPGDMFGAEPCRGACA